jgi:hypothetical protein
MMPVLFCGPKVLGWPKKDARSLSSLRLTFIDDTKLKRVLLGFAAQQIASEVKGLSAGVPWEIPWEIPSAYASADGGLARHEP